MKKLIQHRQDEIKKVYPGLICFKEGVRQIPVESIPGVGMLFFVFISFSFKMLLRFRLSYEMMYGKNIEKNCNCCTLLCVVVMKECPFANVT